MSGPNEMDQLKPSQRKLWGFLLAGVALVAAGFALRAELSSSVSTSRQIASSGASVQKLTAALPQTAEIEHMTWLEVRAALEAGFTTVIVPSGGVEQNGPHMMTGKHNVIVSEAARRIAMAVGKTLVAPTIAYVPEGEYSPATGHMRFPGTIGVPEPVFAGVLEGAARSLKAAGFKTIVFIGDHGGNQPPQAAVADKLSREWKAEGVRVANIGTYYDDKAQTAALLADGFSNEEIGEHASVIDTSELLSIEPGGVHLERFTPDRPEIEPNGARGDPRRANANLGERLLKMRIKAAIAEIRSLPAAR